MSIQYTLYQKLRVIEIFFFCFFGKKNLIGMNKNQRTRTKISKIGHCVSVLISFMTIGHLLLRICLQRNYFQKGVGYLLLNVKSSDFKENLLENGGYQLKVSITQCSLPRKTIFSEENFQKVLILSQAEIQSESHLLSFKTSPQKNLRTISRMKYIFRLKGCV